MLKLAKQGAWVEIRYQNEAGKIRRIEQFHPTMLKGSRLIDSYTADFLKTRHDVFILDVKIL